MIIAAEIGLSHDGSLGYCYAMAGAVACAGATAVKFQCHDGDPNNSFRPGTFFQDRCRQNYWKRTAFTRSQWMGLIEHCRGIGLLVGVTPFSIQAAHKLEGHIDYWKIGSGQTHDRELLQYVHGTAPVVVSTGLSDMAEALRVREIVPGATLLQCCTRYPTQPSEVGVNVMRSYGHPYGLSDHSGTIWPSIVAAWEGADMIEVHVVWDRDQWGPDTKASITVADLRQLVDGTHFVGRMAPVEKNDQAAALEEARRLFRG